MCDTDFANALSSATKPQSLHVFQPERDGESAPGKHGAIGVFAFQVAAMAAIDRDLNGSAATETPTYPHPVARRANCLRGIATVLSASGETNDKMNESQRPTWSDCLGSVNLASGTGGKLCLSPLGDLCLPQ